jgi:two-component system cell cycle response regulator CtrA
MSTGAAMHVICTGDLALDLATKTVRVGGKLVHLGGKAYTLLELMSLRKDTVLTREMMLENLYGGVDPPQIKIIDICLDKLRGKLAHSSARIVETSQVGVIGFRLIGPQGARRS